jgi:hypothetical protein
MLNQPMFISSLLPFIALFLVYTEKANPYHLVLADTPAPGVRQSCKIPADCPLTLFPGGINPVKGIVSVLKTATTTALPQGGEQS